MDKKIYDKYLNVCENPKKIYIPTIDDYIIVSCGRCPRCKLNKCNVLAQRCMLEQEFSPYTVFLTLTYDNEHMPIARCVDDSENFYIVADSPDRPSEYGLLLGKLPKYDSETFHKNNTYLRTIQHANKLTRSPQYTYGYLSYTDIDLFFKRFRHRAKSLGERKLRYAIVGEYGPKTHRPHWHLLLYFSSKSLLTNLKQVLDEIWTYGFHKFSLARNKASNYVASYVSGINSAPRYFDGSLKSVLPKLRHSNKLGFKAFQTTFRTAYTIPYSLFNTRVLKVSGKVRDVSAWREIENYYFPKLSGQSAMSDSFLSRLLRCYVSLAPQIQALCNTQSKLSITQSTKALAHIIGQNNSYVPSVFRDFIKAHFDFFDIQNLSYLFEDLTDENPFSSTYLYNSYFNKLYRLWKPFYRIFEYIIPTLGWSFEDWFAAYKKHLKEQSLSILGDFYQAQSLYVQEHPLSEDYMHIFYPLSDFDEYINVCQSNPEITQRTTYSYLDISRKNKYKTLNDQLGVLERKP